MSDETQLERLPASWSCGRCWLRADGTRSVTVVPVDALVRFLRANPNALGEDILREVENGVLRDWAEPSVSHPVGGGGGDE